jgi:hypothetical protein
MGVHDRQGMRVREVSQAASETRLGKLAAFRELRQVGIGVMNFIFRFSMSFGRNTGF